MAEVTAFNYEEAIHGVLETRTALERAEACVGRLEQLLSENPRSFAPLASTAFRLRDRLIEDLETLEARLAQARSAPASGAGSKVAPQQDPDKPRADRFALGGQ